MQTSANQSGPVVLHAYNATNLAVELYNSSLLAARDNPGLAVKYTMPTIANGKVYVGTANYLTVFGAISPLSAPAITPPGGVFSGSVTVSLFSSSNTAAIYYTLDGSQPTSSSTLYTGPFSISQNTTVQAVAIVAGQANSPIASATFTTSASLSPYEAAVVAAGPLSYWPLTEASGSVAFDLIAGYNGTYVGNAALGQAGPSQAGFGSPSRAALFDGASGYVDVPGPFNLTGPLTAMAWVNAPTTPTHFSGMFGHGDASWRLSINGAGDPGAADGSAPDATSATSIVGSGWRMIAYTYSGVSGGANSGSLYVDGVLVATNNASTPAGDGSDVWIGGSPDYGASRLFAGSMAHAAIFNRCLSVSEIQALRNASNVVPPVTLGLSSVGSGSLTLTWSHGSLVEAVDPAGPWVTNAATSPYVVAPTNAQRYYKVIVN
jgi:hypothetical protein